MNEILQEFSDSRGVRLRIDAARGVLRGVKILGLDSRNGRVYLPQALAAAAALYEGAKVNVNHPKGSPSGPRDYQDRLGQIRGVSVRQGEGLFGDLHFNPKHALAEQLVWDAEHAPQNVGFSHNVEARTARRGEQLVVEAITRVESVDLVADPATTRGLFETALEGAADAVPISTGAALTPALSRRERELSAVTLDDLRAQRPELCAELVREQRDEIARLVVEIAALREAAAVHQRERTMRALLAEFQLPDPDVAAGNDKVLVSDEFVASLLAADGPPAMRRLVEERARLVRELRRGEATDDSGRPRSRDQTQLDAWTTDRLDAKEFARAIT